MISLREIHQRFDTQEACLELLVSLRWPNGVECPRCGNRRVIRIKHRAWNWVCKSGAQSLDKSTGKVSECPKKTGYRFSALVGTVFENTNYPLPLWFEVVYLICQSKKGMSALQVQRMLKENGRPTAYKTAFYMCHRIRAMLGNDEMPKLMGVVEVDETYIGGKDRNRHWDKESSYLRAHADPDSLDPVGFNKTGVIGAISRKGNVVCKVIGSLDAPTMSGFVRKVTSDKVELVATDENQAYKLLGRPHDTVNHSQDEWVRGNVHTNNIESFWSLLKRGVVGTYHNVSKKCLPLYLNEFQWRFNNRKNTNIFFDAIAGC